MYPISGEGEDALYRRLLAKKEINRLQTITAECDRVIEQLLDNQGGEQLQWQHDGEWYVVYRRKESEGRKSISPEKLLDHGVPAHVIQECTVVGKPGKGGITVRKVTDRENDKAD